MPGGSEKRPVPLPAEHSVDTNQKWNNVAGGPIGVTALQNERLALEANPGVRATKYVPPLSNRLFCVLGARTALDLHKKRMNKNIGQFTDNPVPHHSVPQGVSHTIRTISFLATGSMSPDSEQSKSPASLVTQGMA